MKKPKDFIEKLFEPPTQLKKHKAVMIVHARAETSAQIDAEEAAENAAEKYRMPLAFWSAEDDTLEPLTKGDLKKLESLGITPWEWEVIVTENYLEMRERENPHE
jgi:hypothetical protein